MAVDVGTVYSDVRVRLDRLKGDIAAVTKEFDKLGDGVTQSSEKTEKSVSASFGKMLAKIGAFAGAQAIIRNVISTFASFEQSMANVAAVAGATPEEFEKLTAAAREAGETTKFTASQAADALYNLVQAGLDATESIDALDGVLSLAAATGADLATSAATVTASLSQYSLDAKEASRVSNVFAAAISNSQASMEKLGSAFRQVGPVAGALGISLEETTGALQALFDAGFRGEQAGTVLRNILSQLADTAGPASEKLAALGVDMSAIDPTANSLIDVLGTLAEANLSAGDAISVFGLEAGPGLLQLLKAGREGLQDYTDAVTGTNAAAEQAEVQMNTLQGDIYTLNSALEGLAIGVGNGLNPLLRSLAQTLTNIVLAVNAVPDPIKAMTLVFGGAVIAVHAAAAALGGLGVAINVALGPIALIVGGIAALVTGVSAVVDEHKKLERAKLYKQYEKISEAAGLTAEQLEKITKIPLSTHLSGESASVLAEVMEDITNQAAELGREYGKTTLEILKLARANEDLNDAQKKRLDDAIRAEEKQQGLIDASIRYERLRQGEKEAIEARARAQAEQAERERDAILQTLRLEQERVKAVVDARLAAFERTRQAQEQLNREVEAGFKTEEERYKETTKLLEAEAEELFRLGYLGRLVETSWRDATGRLVTGIAEGDRRLHAILQELGNRRVIDSIANNEAIKQDFANTASFMTDVQRAAAQVRADIAKKEMDAKIAAIEEEARKRKEKEEEFISAANFALQYGSEGLRAIAALSKAVTDKEIADLERKKKAELEAAGDNAEEREKIEAKFQKAKAKLEYKAALNAWVLQLGQALLQTAQAALNAYTSTAAIPVIGPVLAPAAAVIAGGFGLAQVATVAAQKPKAPSFATGGIVPGSTYVGDRVQVNANSGEMILTREQQQTLFDTIAGGAIGNGQPIVINFTSELNGRVLAEEVVKYIVRGNVQMPR